MARKSRQARQRNKSSLPPSQRTLDRGEPGRRLAIGASTPHHGSSPETHPEGFLEGAADRQRRASRRTRQLAKTRAFIRASRIHNALEVLRYLSSASFIYKAVERRNQLVWRRATATATARFFCDIRAAIDLDDLIQEAQAREDLTKQEQPISSRTSRNVALSAAIAALILTRQGDISEAGILTALAINARGAARSTALGLGLGRKLSPQFETTPVLALREIFPNQFVSIQANLVETREVYARRLGITIANGVEQDASRAQIEVAVRRLETQTARAVTETETSRVTNGVAHQMAEDADVLRRRLVTLNDNRVCPICIGDAAQGFIPLTQPYRSGAMHPPDQHVNCRCHEEFEGEARQRPDYIPT